MNKEKWFALGAAIVIPLVMLIAFNALVVQPTIGEISAEGRGAGGAIQPAQTFKGVVATNYINDNGTLNVDGVATFGDDMTVAGTLTAAAIVTDGNALLTSVETTGNITDAGTLNVTGASTLDGAVSIGGGFGSTGCSLSAAGVLQCDGAATIGGSLVVTGAQSFIGQTTEATNIIHSSASITPTDGGVLTPTAKLVTLTPAGAVGVSLGSCTTGMETIIYNSVNANVVITDTGNGVLAGNQTLGQFDALMLACYATKWVQISAVSAN